MSSPFLLGFTPYLPEDAAVRMKNYRYKGEDRSLIYKHGWKPFCNWAVNMLPRWLAPNVISTSALVLVFITHCVLFHYLPSFHQSSGDEDPPRWIFLVTGVMLFCYQALDNLDGYQARRTGTSSPLGLMIDHGCDAINCTIGSLSVATAVNCGATWKLWSTFSSTVIVFFLNTWEEYYRGEFILPIVNGPNEGIIIAILIYVTTFFVGPRWWSVTLVNIPVPQAVFETLSATPTVRSWMVDLGADFSTESQGFLAVRANTLAVLFVVSSTVFTALGNIYQVFRATRNRPADRHAEYGSGVFAQKFPFLQALSRLLPLIVLTVLANVWYLWSPSHIFNKHPRLFCWCVGLLYAKLAVHLMIAHVCGLEFHPLRRTLIPFFYLAFHVSVTAVTSKNDVTWDEELFLYEFFALSTITFAHLAINAVLETANALNIRVFTMPPLKAE